MSIQASLVIATVVVYTCLAAFVAVQFANMLAARSQPEWWIRRFVILLCYGSAFCGCMVLGKVIGLLAAASAAELVPQWIYQAELSWISAGQTMMLAFALLIGCGFLLLEGDE